MSFRSALFALVLLCSPAFGQSYMTPATGLADFENPGNSVIEWAFPVEVLWQVTNGKAHLHIEIQTKPITIGSVTYGPGTFIKANASGKFLIWIGSNLAPNPPQFWWPPQTTEMQPPRKDGQNLYGSCSRTVGISAAALLEGYTDLVPIAANDANGIVVILYLKALGKPLKALTAAYFIESGEIQIHCDAYYMVGQ